MGDIEIKRKSLLELSWQVSEEEYRKANQIANTIHGYDSYTK